MISDNEYYAASMAALTPLSDFGRLVGKAKLALDEVHATLVNRANEAAELSSKLDNVLDTLKPIVAHESHHKKFGANPAYLVTSYPLLHEMWRINRNREAQRQAATKALNEFIEDLGTVISLPAGSGPGTDKDIQFAPSSLDECFSTGTELLTSLEKDHLSHPLVTWADTVTSTFAEDRYRSALAGKLGKVDKEKADAAELLLTVFERGLPHPDERSEIIELTHSRNKTLLMGWVAGVIGGWEVVRTLLDSSAEAGTAKDLDVKSAIDVLAQDALTSIEILEARVREYINEVPNWLRTTAYVLDDTIAKANERDAAAYSKQEQELLHSLGHQSREDSQAAQDKRNEVATWLLRGGGLLLGLAFFGLIWRLGKWVLGTSPTIDSESASYAGWLLFMDMWPLTTTVVAGVSLIQYGLHLSVHHKLQYDMKMKKIEAGLPASKKKLTGSFNPKGALTGALETED